VPLFQNLEVDFVWVEAAYASDQRPPTGRYVSRLPANALSMRAMLSKLVLIRVGILKSNSARYRCKSHVLVDAIIPRLRMEKYPSAVFGVGIIPDIFFHGMVDRLGRTSPPISAKPLK
jgi:hypothetical protein